jgi:glycosyltransferase involved in cell wall biosynthesis
MRIAVVSPHLPTAALPMRGVRHSEQLRLFSEAGHEVRAVVPLGRSPRRWLAGTHLPQAEHDGPVTVTHPRYLRPPPWLGAAGLAIERGLFARTAARELARADWRPDVVLTHSVTLPGGLLGRIGPAALVVTLHDHELYELAPRSGWLRRQIARTLRRAHCAVYVSEALRRHGEALAGPHRARVIPIGIDTVPGLTAVSPGRFTVCAVSRLIARKRLDRLVRAFARLAVERPEARLVIVGEGPERPALARLVRALGLAEKVQLTGALDARATLDRVARASVMALPSVRESLGAVYLEAMALGVPALGTRGEGIEAYIEHGVTGLLVPPDDEERLVAELRALADDPARARRIGEAGRRLFLAGHLSWRANAEAYLSLFEELASGRAMHTT